MYAYFNASFWRKVDEYGKSKMEEDIKTLRKLREKRKKTERLKLFRSRRVYNTKLTEKKNIRLFQKIKNNYNSTLMAEALKYRILRKDPRLNQEQVFLLTKSMIKGQGGCPVATRTKFIL